MDIIIRSDSVEITGYVNAVERDSQPLRDRFGQFIERIRKGAFKRAIQKNSDIHVLLNHDWSRDLGSTTRGNLELTETLREKQRKGSLLWVLDRTKTAMGARLLRSFLEQPLIEADEIERRL